MPPPGDVGDDDPSPQPENSVTRVTPEAAWQAPAQKRRRETAVVVSDIAEILVGWGGLPGGRGKIEATGKTITGSLNQPLAYLREMKGRPDTISSVRRGM
jgi:hypothetical protein